MYYIKSKKKSEAVVKAEFYCALKSLNLKDIFIDCEYKVPSKDPNQNRKYDVFDIVLVYDNRIILIIEIKSKQKSYSGFVVKEYNKLKQLDRYLEHGIPVMLCSNIRDIIRCCNLIKDRIDYLKIKPFIQKKQKKKESFVDNILNGGLYL